MELLLKLKFSAPFFGVVLLGLCISYISASQVLAEEFMNISKPEGCRAIGGDEERLRCYDTVFDGGVFDKKQLRQVQVEKFGDSKMKKAPVPEPEATSETAPAIAPATAKVENNARPKNMHATSDRLSVTIVASQKSNVGIHYFKTSEGQVWKQQNAGSWGGGVPFDAVIKTGSFGSFTLIKEGGKSTRVKRVK